MNFLQTSHELLTIFYELLKLFSHFLQTSYELLTNVL
jgi:hypothetical protein